MDGTFLSNDTSQNDELSEYLERPLTPPDPAILAPIETGPADPGQALARAELDRLLDPAPLELECGWCSLPDGVGCVAVRTRMRGLSGPMVDWWFDWHARDPLRYRIWHPLAHRGNSVDPPAKMGPKPHWGAVHHPVEDVGTGVVHARIQFLAPTELGFSTDALDDPRIATIVCGQVADDRLGIRHSVMAHVFLEDGDGLVLRSHFWLGALIRPAFARRLALPSALPRALARHCAEEYSNLADLLPELYGRFGT
jgi:hypothetical protein